MPLPTASMRFWASSMASLTGLIACFAPSFTSEILPLAVFTTPSTIPVTDDCADEQALKSAALDTATAKQAIRLQKLRLIVIVADLEELVERTARLFKRDAEVLDLAVLLAQRG